MSKILAILMVLVLILGLSACGIEESERSANDKKTPAEVQTSKGTAKRLTRATVSVSGSEGGTGYLDYVYDNDGLERIDFYLDGQWNWTELFCGSIDCPEGKGTLDDDGEMHKNIDRYYDEYGNLIQYYNDGVQYYLECDWKGNPTFETQYHYYDGDSRQIKHISYTYEDGLLIKTNTYSLSVYYDDDDSEPSVWSSGEAYTYELYDSGEVKKQTVSYDSGSVIEIYEYDEHGNLTHSENWRGTPCYIYDYQYDEQGNLIKEACSYVMIQEEGSSSSDGPVTTYRYDDQNRLVEECSGYRTITYHYNANGDVEKVISENGDDYVITITYAYETVNESEAIDEDLDQYIDYAIDCF